MRWNTTLGRLARGVSDAGVVVASVLSCLSCSSLRTALSSRLVAKPRVGDSPRAFFSQHGRGCVSRGVKGNTSDAGTSGPKVVARGRVRVVAALAEAYRGRLPRRRRMLRVGETGVGGARSRARTRARRVSRGFSRTLSVVPKSEERLWERQRKREFQKRVALYRSCRRTVAAAGSSASPPLPPSSSRPGKESNLESFPSLGATRHGPSVESFPHAFLQKRAKSAARGRG